MSDKTPEESKSAPDSSQDSLGASDLAEGGTPDAPVEPVEGRFTRWERWVGPKVRRFERSPTVQVVAIAAAVAGFIGLCITVDLPLRISSICI
ncbi:MAG: hypothetical protein GY807_04525 [Gammaproteobacteria bacterium]|nr:hypothetical protein [Gammaproteobacteria bacterium]